MLRAPRPLPIALGWCCSGALAAPQFHWHVLLLAGTNADGAVASALEAALEEAQAPHLPPFVLVALNWVQWEGALVLPLGGLIEVGAGCWVRAEDGNEAFYPDLPNVL